MESVKCIVCGKEMTSRIQYEVYKNNIYSKFCCPYYPPPPKLDIRKQPHLASEPDVTVGERVSDITPPLRILLIEDDMNLQRLLKEALCEDFDNVTITSFLEVTVTNLKKGERYVGRNVAMPDG
jgi:hypothetical protein